ncbi:Gfo/Idh/MocA family protein [Actinomadura rubrisoli]|nr:Gfo/Idh/MocA family oxidoreductase [Actinomadura rubrisoli]
MVDKPVVRLGVVGFGRHFRRYLLPNVIAEPRLSIRKIAELDPGLRAEAGCRFPGVRLVERAEQVFGDPEVDAVLISTTPATHVPLAEAAVRSGKHVFVEKPLGTSAAPVRRLAEVGAEHGCAVMSGLMWRRAPVTQVVREWLAGRGAHTRLLNMTVTLPFIDLKPSWRGDWGLSLRENAYYDGFIHPIDWASSMLGPIGEAHARELDTGDGRLAVHLWIEGAARDRAGAVTLVTGSDAYDVTALGHASDGSLWQMDTMQRVTVTAQPTWTGTPGGIRDRTTRCWEPGQLYRGWGRYGYAEEFAAFAESVTSDAPTEGTDLDDVARTYDVIEAVMRSVAERTTVQVPEPVPRRLPG